MLPKGDVGWLTPLDHLILLIIQYQVIYRDVIGISGKGSRSSPIASSES